MDSSLGCIDVDGVSMTYRVPVREAGLGAAVRSIWRRQTKSIQALQSVSLRVDSGESVALIGPNGAGKTTLMKILAGILRPTAGRARVLGQDPFNRRPDYLHRIALVRGSQPLGGSPELTVMDSLKYQRLVYDLGAETFRGNLEELVQLLDIGGILNRQVRALSLGERMRAGLAMAFLYRPAVLFLDEPTIGLDVSAAVQTRSFLKQYVTRTGATLLLTSHYMNDVEELCPRVVLVNQGQKLFDGAFAELTARFRGDKLIEVWTADGADLPADLSAVRVDGHYTLSVARDQVPAVAGRLLANTRILDLTVRDAPLDVVVDQIYRNGRLDSQ